MDGLDESVASQQDTGQPTIASVVLRCAREAPPWLVFVVTSRSEVFAAALARSAGAAAAGEMGGLLLSFPGCSASVPAGCCINLDDSARSAADVSECAWKEGLKCTRARGTL